MSVCVKDITNVEEEFSHLSKEQLIAVKHFIAMELLEGTPIDKVYVTGWMREIEGNAYNGVGVCIARFEKYGEVYITTSPTCYSHQDCIEDEPLEKWNMHDLEKYGDDDFNSIFERFKPKLGKGDLLTSEKLSVISKDSEYHGGYIFIECLQEESEVEDKWAYTHISGVKRLIWDNEDENEIVIYLGKDKGKKVYVALSDLECICKVAIYGYNEE